MSNTATTIEWTDTTWNPVTGCDRVSPGCDHCYALTLAKRLKTMGNPRYQNDGSPRTSGPGFGVTMHDDVLLEPLSWKKRRRVFVNSMSDLFHSNVSTDFIARAFAIMGVTRWTMFGQEPHVFQVLTKRPSRAVFLLKNNVEFQSDVARYMRSFSKLPIEFGRDWWPLSNVWIGVSVEDQRWANNRIPQLLKIPAAVRFLSCEPLLGPVDLSKWLYRWRCSRCGYETHDLECVARTLRAGEMYLPCPRCESASDFVDMLPLLDWVIVGGESGQGARAMDPQWVRSLRDQCVGAGVSFFFKQHGGRTPKAGGREIDGRTWDEFPGVTPST